MGVGQYDAGGADNAAGEHERPVPLWAVGEREEDGSGDAKRLAENYHPLRIDLAREGTGEASEEGDDASREPRTKSTKYGLRGGGKGR